MPLRAIKSLAMLFCGNSVTRDEFWRFSSSPAAWPEFRVDRPESRGIYFREMDAWISIITMATLINDVRGGRCFVLCLWSPWRCPHRMRKNCSYDGLGHFSMKLFADQIEQMRVRPLMKASACHDVFRAHHACFAVQGTMRSSSPSCLRAASSCCWSFSPKETQVRTPTWRTLRPPLEHRR
eukprot:3838501-Pleurochrysis_carterae.AAC.1